MSGVVRIALLQRNRLFEWVTSVITLAVGIHLIIWPHAIEQSAFRLILTLIGNQTLTLIFLSLGILRIAALISNGRSTFYGPHVRSLGALFGACLWGQMAWALAMLIPEFGMPPSVGVEVYLGLCLGEMISIYRARCDVWQ